MSLDAYERAKALAATRQVDVQDDVVRLTNPFQMEQEVQMNETVWQLIEGENPENTRKHFTQKNVVEYFEFCKFHFSDELHPDILARHKSQEEPAHRHRTEAKKQLQEEERQLNKNNNTINYYIILIPLTFSKTTIISTMITTMSTTNITDTLRSFASRFDRDHLWRYWELTYQVSMTPIKIFEYLATAVLIIAIGLALRYRNQIKRHMKSIDDSFSRGLVYRDSSTINSSSSRNRNSSDSSSTKKQKRRRKVVKCLELEPQFVEQYPDWQLCSFGEYLSTLRFFTQDGSKQRDDDDDCEDDDDGENDGSTRDRKIPLQYDSKLSKVVEREIRVAMGSAILSSFGPQIGGMLLPLLGIRPVESIMTTMFSKLLSWIVATVMVDFGSDFDPIGDMAAMPFNVSELISFVNLNQKFKQPGRDKEKEAQLLEAKRLRQRQAEESFDDRSDDDFKAAAAESSPSSLPTPLEWMKRGEVGFDPTYYTPPLPAVEDTNDDKVEEQAKVLIPNPFIVEDHFDAAIAGLEDRIRQNEGQGPKNRPEKDDNGDDHPHSSTGYDPDDTSLSTPTPINERLLPGLHLGWGDAKCSHTKREILRNRLFAVLMTKLSRNFYCRRQGMDSQQFFIVCYNGKDCKFPDEFVQCLLDSGHEIEVCPRSTITTFGMALCVKEDDGSWTNVPLAFFFRSGYERLNRRPVYFACPHGGVDMKIKGPLVGPNSKCDIQFYMAIEGMCGWHSNHIADVPWLRPVSTTEVYDKEKAITAIRMSGLLACTFNSIGTELNLPFGGYGVLGVCNDTAAFVDCAVRGTTNMYPLLSTGRFLMYTSAYLMETKKRLSSYDDMTAAAADAHRLAAATCKMESDLHCAPMDLIGAMRRYVANYPVSYFQIMEDSREEMKNISTDYKHFEEGRKYLDLENRMSVNKFVEFLSGKEGQTK